MISFSVYDTYVYYWRAGKRLNYRNKDTSLRFIHFKRVAYEELQIDLCPKIKWTELDVNP